MKIEIPTMMFFLLFLNLVQCDFYLLDVEGKHELTGSLYYM